VEPETRYAKTVDGVHIAYQVRGDGPIDLVYILGFASCFEVELEFPARLEHREGPGRRVGDRVRRSRRARAERRARNVAVVPGDAFRFAVSDQPTARTKWYANVWPPNASGIMSVSASNADPSLRFPRKRNVVGYACAWTRFQ